MSLNLLFFKKNIMRNSYYKKYLARLLFCCFAAVNLMEFVFGRQLPGYNGSQLWDTAFTVKAILSSDLIEEFGHTLKLAHDYIKNTQVIA